MRRLLYGLTALPLLFGGPGLAQPIQLSNAEMDQVSAGFFELDVSNTSVTEISLFRRINFLTPTPTTIACSSCYLLLNTPTFSVASQIGPPN